MAEVSTVAVVGAGTMGSRIAYRALFSGGHRVVLTDTDAPRLDKVVSEAPDVAQRMCERGFRTRPQVDRALRRFSGTPDLAAAVADADLVIEAVNEDRKLKLDLWRRLDRYCAGHAILATNSSTYFASELAAGTGRVHRACGMHFSSPLTMLSLCEVSRTPVTEEAVVDAVVSFLRRLECVPVVLTGEVFGHVCNRLLLLLVDEALRLVAAGHVAAPDVDVAVKTGLGFPYGPFELIDHVGFDAMQEMLREAAQRGLTAPPPVSTQEGSGGVSTR